MLFFVLFLFQLDKNMQFVIALFVRVTQTRNENLCVCVCVCEMLWQDKQEQHLENTEKGKKRKSFVLL